MRRLWDQFMAGPRRMARQWRTERRVLLWGAFWYVATALAVDAVTWFPLAIIAALVVLNVAEALTRHRSLRYRWQYLRHWRDVHTPCVIDEDNNIRAAIMLPGDALDVRGEFDYETGIGTVYTGVWRRHLLRRGTHLTMSRMHPWASPTPPMPR